MSRAIGDRVAARIGVSNEPEITQTFLTGQEKAVLLGSDGLWEFLKAPEVLALTARFWEGSSARGVALGLAQAAYERWLSTEGFADDVTVVCVMLEAPGLINGRFQ